MIAIPAGKAFYLHTIPLFGTPRSSQTTGCPLQAARCPLPVLPHLRLHDERGRVVMLHQLPHSAKGVQSDLKQPPNLSPHLPYLCAAPATAQSDLARIRGPLRVSCDGGSRHACASDAPMLNRPGRRLSREKEKIHWCCMWCSAGHYGR